MPEPSVSSIAIYQLRLVLCGVSPLVWRRLLVVSETSLGELHEMLQSAFGWSGEHLHRFLIHGVAYGIPNSGGIVFGEDARGCPFPVSVCIAASASAMNTTSRPIGSWTFGLRGLCPLIQNAFFRHASTEGELRRRKIVLEPWILKRLDWHRSHLPIDEMLIMVEAMRRILDFDGDRHAIGDLDELREAVDRVKAYQDFQPDRFNRRELNLQLRALAQDREARL
jgi:hypothetical protein